MGKQGSTEAAYTKTQQVTIAVDATIILSTHTGKGGIARSQLNAANVSGENGTDRAIAAMAPAPLAAAPEQALKAEVSEAASEPELLFAPDFIISQVCHKTDLMAFYAKQHSILWQLRLPGLQASSICCLLLLLSCTAQTPLLTVCTGVLEQGQLHHGQA